MCDACRLVRFDTVKMKRRNGKRASGRERKMRNEKMRKWIKKNNLNFLYHHLNLLKERLLTNWICKENFVSTFFTWRLEARKNSHFLFNFTALIRFFSNRKLEVIETIVRFEFWISISLLFTHFVVITSRNSFEEHRKYKKNQKNI